MDEPRQYTLDIFYSQTNRPDDTLTIGLLGPENDLMLHVLKYPRRGDTFKLYGQWHSYDGVVANARQVFGLYLADRVPGSRLAHDDSQARQRLLAAQDQVTASKTGKVWTTVQDQRAMLYAGSLNACYAWAWTMRDNLTAAGLEIIDDDDAHVEFQAPLGDPLANQEVWSL